MDLLSPHVWDELSPSLRKLVGAVDELRWALKAATRRPLLEEAELQLLLYPPGGHYQRHIDDGLSTINLPIRRSISMIVYFTEDDWHADIDGGALKIYDAVEESRSYCIPPQPGTLVVFDSRHVSHEVLKTHRARLACVGWFLESRSIDVK